eukprot:11754590-Karenia_brevis.AAC.1
MHNDAKTDTDTDTTQTQIQRHTDMRMEKHTLHAQKKKERNIRHRDLYRHTDGNIDRDTDRDIDRDRHRYTGSCGQSPTYTEHTGAEDKRR